MAPATAAAPTTSTTATTPSTPSTSTTPPDDGIEVLDPGTAPRRQLVLHLTEGQLSRTTLGMTMTMKSPGVDLPPIPITMVMSTEVADVVDDRSTVRATYDDITVDADGLPSDLADGLTSGMAGIKGMKATFTYSPNGALLDTDVTLPAGAPPSAQQLVDQISNSMTSLGVAFPTEPLGEGARWQRSSTSDVAGNSLRQTTVYELEQFDGEHYRIGVETRGVMHPQDVGGVNFSDAKIVSGGDMSGGLGQVMPTAGTSRGTTTMSFDVAGHHVRMTTTIDMILSTSVR